jgi:prefoldin beta subunit
LGWFLFAYTEKPQKDYVMSDELSKLPPQVQERFMRLQQTQQTLQTILAQKQQVDMESAEIDQTLKELEKTADDAVIYKAAGSLLIKAEKAKVAAELNERKDLLATRQTVMARQEERMRTQLKDLQTQLQADLSPASQAPQPS